MGRKFNDDDADDNTDDKVVVVWGEEKVSLVPYTTCTIGPFHFETKIRADESPEDAFDRAMKVVRFIAERERKFKVESYRQIAA